MGPRGDTAAFTLSTEDGRFGLRLAPNRAYTLLVRSIGMQPVRLNVGPFSAAADTSISVEMQPIVFTLATIVVNSRFDGSGVVPHGYFPVSNARDGFVMLTELVACSREQAGTERVRELWTEVAKSLEVAIATQRLIKRPFDWRVFQMHTNPRSGERELEAFRHDTSVTERPFRTVAARSLANDGYVVVQRGGNVYRAPGEEVLLDRSFLEYHCFWVTSGEGDKLGQVGLSFTPTEDYRLNDIAGTFWVDEKTFALQGLQFSYTRTRSSRARRFRAQSVAETGKLPDPVRMDSLAANVRPEQSLPGGELLFARLADGTVIIESWRLWITDLWTRTDATGEPLRTPKSVIEQGGAVLGVVSGGG
jgi:hypothetical protein